MPLHDRATIRQQFDDCVFADRDLTKPVHKYRFPQDGTLPRDARSEERRVGKEC